MDKIIEIKVPAGYMNIGVTLDNCLIADTNDSNNSNNWYEHKMELPQGKWEVYSINGTKVRLIWKNKSCLRIGNKELIKGLEKKWNI